MWDVRRNVLANPAPRQSRYVAEFRLSGVPISRRRYWLVFERGTIDLCYRDPGFNVDLFVEVSLRVLTQVWLGHITIEQAIRDNLLRLDGSRSDIARFRSWFKLNMFAPAGREPAGPVDLAWE
jgi:hypothetical protein